MKLGLAIRILLALYDAKESCIETLSVEKLQQRCCCNDRGEFRRFLSLLETGGMIQCVAFPALSNEPRVILRMDLKEITLQKIVTFTGRGKANRLPDYMRDVTMLEVKEKRDQMDNEPPSERRAESMWRECRARIEAREKEYETDNALKYRHPKHRLLMN